MVRVIQLKKRQINDAGLVGWQVAVLDPLNLEHIRCPQVSTGASSGRYILLADACGPLLTSTGQLTVWLVDDLGKTNSNVRLGRSKMVDCHHRES